MGWLDHVCYHCSDGIKRWQLQCDHCGRVSDDFFSGKQAAVGVAGASLIGCTFGEVSCPHCRSASEGEFFRGKWHESLDEDEAFVVYEPKDECEPKQGRKGDPPPCSGCNHSKCICNQ